MENTEKINKLKGMLEEAPDDSFLLFALAKAYSNLGNHTAAISTFEQLRSINPQYIGLYYHLAQDYETIKSFDKAKAIYEEGISRCSLTHDAQTRAELQNALINLEIDRDFGE